MLFSDASWYDEELAILSDGVGKFLDAELMPQEEAFAEAGMVARDFWRVAGENGLLGASIPEEYGGFGGTCAHDAIIFAELGLRGVSSFGAHVHNIAVHYLLAFATEDQKQRWLPRLASGDLVGAIAMTEPGTGSDLQAVKTSARREGDNYVVNGSKTFITNGQVGDFIVVVVKTDTGQGARGVSLLGIETEGLEGFRRGRNLEKIGLKGQDTSELFFDDMKVPVENLIGGVEGQGFFQLMGQLPWERLMIGITGVAVADYAIRETVNYTKERKAFGKQVLDFQNTRFKLAECRIKAEVAKAYIEKCVGKHLEGKLTAEEASIAKCYGTDIQNEVVDECLQLHGGYGYMMEYPIARMFVDARVQRIYGGTNEIMKELISRSLMG